jgi:transglutaminase-like putative cysteine protease
MIRVAVCIALAMCSVCCFPATTWSGVIEDIDAVELAKSAPSADEFPEASAGILMARDVLMFEKDGSVISNQHVIIKVFKLRGRQMYSNLKRLYDEDRQELVVKRAQTIRKNFKRIDVDDDEVNDITPQWLKDASLYSNVLHRVISFPAVGKETVVELVTEKKTLPTEDGSFSVVVPLRTWEDPVMTRELVVAVPEDIELRYVSERYDADPMKVSSGGKTYYIWKIEDLDQIEPEPYMPPLTEISPSVVVSTAESWQKICSTFATEFFPRAVCDKALARQVKDLTSGKLSPEEKLRNVFLHVTQEVRNVDLPLGLGGYEPHDASEVYHNRYGDCRDKAVLLVAMLRKAGLKAYPALVRRQKTTFVKEVPTLKQFDHIVVAIENTPHNYTFLDPFARDCLYGYFRNGVGNMALIVKENGIDFHRIPEFSAERNVAEKMIELTVSDDASARGVASASLDGRFDRRARLVLKDATPTEREMILSQAANRVSEGTEELSHSISDLKDHTTPAVVTQEFKAKDYCAIQGDMMILRIPEFPFEFASSPSYVSLSSRTYPLQLIESFEDTYRVTITTPPGYRLVYSPPGVGFGTGEGSWRLRCEQTADGQIEYERGFTIEKHMIPADDYSDFKEAFDKISGPKSELILLERTTKIGD